MHTANVLAAATTAADLVRRSAALDPTHGPDIDGSGFSVQIHDVGFIFEHDEFIRADGSSRLIRTYEAGAAGLPDLAA